MTARCKACGEVNDHPLGRIAPANCTGPAQHRSFKDYRCPCGGEKIEVLSIAPWCPKRAEESARYWCETLTARQTLEHLWGYRR